MVETPASALSYTATSPTVTGRDGVRRNITEPLVEEANRGHGGWKVRLTIKGHTQEVTGATARATYKLAAALLTTNGIPFKELDLWLNLNIQWVGRAIAKRQVVRIEDLMAVATGNAAPAVAHASKANVPPKAWGRKGWGMLQMYLAQDVYSYATFFFLANELSNWVNPDINPSIGCSECYQHYIGALAELRGNPLHVQADARKWLWRLLNKVNARRAAEGDAKARQWTYEEAATVNLWT